MNIPIGVIRPKQKALKDNNGPQEKKLHIKLKIEQLDPDQTQVSLNWLRAIPINIRKLSSVCDTMWIMFGIIQLDEQWWQVKQS